MHQHRQCSVARVLLYVYFEQKWEGKKKLRNNGHTKYHILQLLESPDALLRSHPWLLTVVGEARFAETHEQVLLYFIRCHKLGAYRTVEAWEENTKTRTWGPRCSNVSLVTFYWYVHNRGRGTVCTSLVLHSSKWPKTCMHLLALCLL